MRVVVLTAVWKRHKLFKIFLEGFNRIKKDSQHELILVTIGSEKKTFSDNHLESKNFPLSVKWQNGVDYARDLNPDYILMLGSDDFVCSNLLKFYTQAMDKGTDLIGLIDCYFFDARVNKLTYWLGYRNHRRGESIGMARMLSKELLNKLDWKVWRKPINRGLDSEMMRNLNTIKYSKAMFSCKKEDIMALDVKTDVNISNIKTYRDLHLVDTKELSRFVSENEFYSLINLK